MKPFYNHFKLLGHTMLQTMLLTLLLVSVSLGASAGADKYRWDETSNSDYSRINSTTITLVNGVVDIPDEFALAKYVITLKNSQGNQSDYSSWNKATLNITGDINLDAHPWCPIGEVTGGSWEGSIQGNNHTISYMVFGNTGSVNAGLIDVIKGNVKIQNLTFANCHNTFNDNNSSIICGKAESGTTLTVENVSFSNCKIQGNSYDGLIIGGMESGCKLTVKDVTLTGCSVTARGSYVGSLVGYMKSGTASFENVSITDCALSGNKYVGHLLGWHESGSQTNIDNSMVYNSSISNSDSFTGGFLGEVQGQGHIYNSILRSTSFNQHKHATGGLVGKTYGSGTNFTINNCTVDVSGSYFWQNQDNTPYTQGGVVGLAGNGSHAYVYNTVVLHTNTLKSFARSDQGMIVGNNDDSGRGSVTVQHCYLNNTMTISDSSKEDEELMHLAIGKNIWNSTPDKWTMECTAIKRWATDPNPSAHEQGAYLTALINQADGGAMFTYDHKTYPFQIPVSSADDGMILMYKKKSTDIADYTSNNVSSKYLKYGDYFMLYNGKKVTYTFAPDAKKWIIKDASTNLEDVVRESAVTYSGTPSYSPAGTSASGTSGPGTYYFDCSLSETRPEVAFTSACNYDAVQQRVNLYWGFANSTETDFAKYWIGGHWQVYRDNELVADNLTSDYRQWTDYTPVLGTISTYRLEFIEDNLKFGVGDLLGSHSINIQCDENINIPLELEHLSNGAKLTAMIPNSHYFDGCKVSLYRWKKGDNVDVSKLDSNSKYYVSNQIFAVDDKSDLSSIPVVFTDESNETLCTMLTYIAICTDFTSDFYKGKTVNSSTTQFMPSQRVTITSLSASKGDSDSEVRINWTSEVKDAGGLTITYAIERKVYNREEAGLTVDQDSL